MRFPSALIALAGLAVFVVALQLGEARTPSSATSGGVVGIVDGARLYEVRYGEVDPSNDEVVWSYTRLVAGNYVSTLDYSLRNQGTVGFITLPEGGSIARFLYDGDDVPGEWSKVAGKTEWRTTSSASVGPYSFVTAGLAGASKNHPPALLPTPDVRATARAVLSGAVTNNTEQGIEVSFQSTDATLDFGVPKITPVFNRYVAAVMRATGTCDPAGYTPTAADFTGSRGAVSQSANIRIPNPTGIPKYETSCFYLAVPDAQSDIGAVTCAGQLGNVFPNKASATVTIGGSQYKYWYSNSARLNTNLLAGRNCTIASP